jgi:hypothetical protein
VQVLGERLARNGFCRVVERTGRGTVDRSDRAVGTDQRDDRADVGNDRAEEFDIPALEVEILFGTDWTTLFACTAMERLRREALACRGDGRIIARFPGAGLSGRPSNHVSNPKSRSHDSTKILTPEN